MRGVLRNIKKTYEDGEVFIVALTCPNNLTDEQVREWINQSDSQLTGWVKIGKLTRAGWVAMPGWEIIDDTITPDWPIIEPIIEVEGRHHG